MVQSSCRPPWPGDEQEVATISATGSCETSPPSQCKGRRGRVPGYLQRLPSQTARRTASRGIVPNTNSKHPYSPRKGLPNCETTEHLFPNAFVSEKSDCATDAENWSYI